MSNLEDIFSGYKIESREKITGYKPITFWIPEDSKVKYDKIQDFTHRQFCKKLKEILVSAIDRTAKDIAG